jgi:hypothetical protein
MYCVKVNKDIPGYRPWRPIGLREVKAPTLLRHTGNRCRQGCQPYAPAALYPQVSFIFKDSWYLFLSEAESNPGPVRPEVLGQFKKIPPHRDLTPRPSGFQQCALTNSYCVIM